MKTGLLEIKTPVGFTAEDAAAVARLLKAVSWSFIPSSEDKTSNDSLSEEELRAIDEGIADVEAGRVTLIKDVHNVWDSIL